jgi:hypothetical protein
LKSEINDSKDIILESFQTDFNPKRPPVLNFHKKIIILNFQEFSIIIPKFRFGIITAFTILTIRVVNKMSLINDRLVDFVFLQNNICFVPLNFSIVDWKLLCVSLFS